MRIINHSKLATHHAPARKLKVHGSHGLGRSRVIRSGPFVFLKQFALVAIHQPDFMHPGFDMLGTQLCLPGIHGTVKGLHGTLVRAISTWGFLTWRIPKAPLVVFLKWSNDMYII